ncbi:hypothetical protein [Prosthecochloris sp.]|uniref:hypothetical protein n=1 Tax=Prosthecochloris sp. TaxID=290513 RepID=UPI00257EFC3D|nr:hypothetical protein [Prosthecochloris sp.]
MLRIIVEFRSTIRGSTGILASPYGCRIKCGMTPSLRHPRASEARPGDPLTFLFLSWMPDQVRHDFGGVGRRIECGMTSRELDATPSAP